MLRCSDVTGLHASEEIRRAPWSKVTYARDETSELPWATRQPG